MDACAAQQAAQDRARQLSWSEHAVHPCSVGGHPPLLSAHKKARTVEVLGFFILLYCVPGMFSGWTCPARECSQARHLLPHRKMIEFMRCDDQPDGSLAVILPQAVSHGAGSKGRARDPGILKAAFEQMGDLMKKALPCCAVQSCRFCPCPGKDSQGMCCCQSRARLTIAPCGDGSVCSLACRAGRKRRPHSVRRRKGAVSFQEREWSKRWSSSLSRCNCSRWARNSCSSSVRVISSGDVMAVLPAVSA